MTRTAHALAFLVVFIWGFNFIVIRWGMEAMHPLTMTALRFLLTAVPLVFFIQKPDVSMRYVAAYGVLFGSGVWGLTNLAIALGTPAGMASLLLQLSPFLTVLVAVFGFGERLSRVQVLGIITAFIGFITVCLPQIRQPSALGMGLVLLAAVCWTACNVIIKHSKPKNVISFTVWSSVFCACAHRGIFGGLCIILSTGLAHIYHHRQLSRYRLGAVSSGYRYAVWLWRVDASHQPLWLVRCCTVYLACTNIWGVFWWAVL